MLYGGVVALTKNGSSMDLRVIVLRTITDIFMFQGEKVRHKKGNLCEDKRQSNQNIPWIRRNANSPYAEKGSPLCRQYAKAMV